MLQPFQAPSRWMHTPSRRVLGQGVRVLQSDGTEGIVGLGGGTVEFGGVARGAAAWHTQQKAPVAEAATGADVWRPETFSNRAAGRANAGVHAP